MSDDLKKNEQEIESMPKEIKNALTKYTQTVEINRQLRHRNFQLTSQKRPKEMQKMLRRMDMAYFLVTPLAHDIVVYRAIKGDTFYEDDLGFTSTSIIFNKNVEDFGGNGCCLFIIKIPAGTSILRIPASVGYFGEENEVLLYRNGTFRETSPFAKEPTTPLKIFFLEYAQHSLPPQNLDTIHQIKNYMHISHHILMLIDKKDLNSFKSYLTAKNSKHVFRCLVGNIGFRLRLYPFFEALITMYPDVIYNIDELGIYLKNKLSSLIVEEIIYQIYAFEYRRSYKSQVVYFCDAFSYTPFKPYLERFIEYTTGETMKFAIMEKDDEFIKEILTKRPSFPYFNWWYAIFEYRDMAIAKYYIDTEPMAMIKLMSVPSRREEKNWELFKKIIIYKKLPFVEEYIIPTIASQQFEYMSMFSPQYVEVFKKYLMDKLSLKMDSPLWKQQITSLIDAVCSYYIRNRDYESIREIYKRDKNSEFIQQIQTYLPKSIRQISMV